MGGRGSVEDRRCWEWGSIIKVVGSSKSGDAISVAFRATVKEIKFKVGSVD